MLTLKPLCVFSKYGLQLIASLRDQPEHSKWCQMFFTMTLFQMSFGHLCRRSPRYFYGFAAKFCNIISYSPAGSIKLKAMLIHAQTFVFCSLLPLLTNNPSIFVSIDIT